MRGRCFLYVFFLLVCSGRCGRLWRQAPPPATSKEAAKEVAAVTAACRGLVGRSSVRSVKIPGQSKQIWECYCAPGQKLSGQGLCALPAVVVGFRLEALAGGGFAARDPGLEGQGCACGPLGAEAEETRAPSPTAQGITLAKWMVILLLLIGACAVNCWLLRRAQLKQEEASRADEDAAARGARRDCQAAAARPLIPLPALWRPPKPRQPAAPSMAPKPRQSAAPSAGRALRPPRPPTATPPPATPPPATPLASPRGAPTPSVTPPPLSQASSPPSSEKDPGSDVDEKEEALGHVEVIQAEASKTTRIVMLLNRLNAVGPTLTTTAFLDPWAWSRVRGAHAERYKQWVDRLEPVTREDHADRLLGLRYAMKFAIAVYANREPLDTALKGLVNISPQQVKARARADKKKMLELIGLGKSALLDESFEVQALQPVYALVLDRDHKTVVLTIRGTLTVDDMITDLEHHSVDFEISSAAGSVHQGVLSAAMWVKERAQAALQIAARRYPGYRLVVTGHSLGAAVAAFVAILLEDDRKRADPDLEGDLPMDVFERVECYTFACPKVASESLACCSDALRTVTTLQLGCDAITRMTPSNVNEMWQELATSKPRASASKPPSEDLRRGSTASSASTRARTASPAPRGRPSTASRPHDSRQSAGRSSSASKAEGGSEQHSEAATQISSDPCRPFDDPPEEPEDVHLAVGTCYWLSNKRENQKLCRADQKDFELFLHGAMFAHHGLTAYKASLRRWFRRQLRETSAPDAAGDEAEVDVWLGYGSAGSGGDAGSGCDSGCDSGSSFGDELAQDHLPVEAMPRDEDAWTADVCGVPSRPSSC